MVKSNYIVCYDITEDDVRTSISDICKNTGLQRIQYSVFSGKLSKAELKNLRVQLKATLSNCTGQILILPSCASCLKKREIMTSSIDETEDEPVDPIEEEEVIIF